MANVLQDYHRSLLRKLGQLAKMACSRILGTVQTTNGAYKALHALEHGRMLARCELDALSALLVKKGLVTREELTEQTCIEMQHRLEEHRREWPEVTDVQEDRISLDIQSLHKRCKDEGWPP
jgi:hypothetical protein